MSAVASPTRLENKTGTFRGRSRGFSLIELLVAIGIIALIASIGIPRLKGFGKGNKVAGAQRQLLDDMARARLQAISTRSTVYMVFVPPTLMDHIPAITDVRQRRQLTNLISGQFSSYSLFSFRRVGSQPGQKEPRYLTEWRRLPEGMLILPQMYPMANQQKPLAPLFDATRGDVRYEDLRGFSFEVFPFPSAGSPGFLLPYLAFDSRGQLTSAKDELVALAEGSAFLQKDANGNFRNSPADVNLRPQDNWTNNLVRINWLTGRAGMDQATRPQFRN